MACIKSQVLQTGPLKKRSLWFASWKVWYQVCDNTGQSEKVRKLNTPTELVSLSQAKLCFISGPLHNCAGIWAAAAAASLKKPQQLGNQGAMLTVKYTQTHKVGRRYWLTSAHFGVNYILFIPSLLSATRYVLSRPQHSQVLSPLVHVRASRWAPAQHSTHMADGMHTWAACYQQTGQKKEDEWRLFSSETGALFTKKRATEWLPGNRTPGSTHAHAHRRQNFRVFFFRFRALFSLQLKRTIEKNLVWLIFFFLQWQMLYALPRNTLIVYSRRTMSLLYRFRTIFTYKYVWMH